MEKYIWLIGENEAKTANNNSFYYWQHVVDIDDDIKKYFVLCKTPKNIEHVQSMPKKHQNLIIWRNSLKHHIIYKKSDIFFVSLSYKDILPTELLGKVRYNTIVKPVIYLQHGTLAMKKLGYTGKSYNNNMFRFVLYNQKIRKQFETEHNFRPYQLYYGVFPPRYKQLVNMQNDYMLRKEKKQILWFLTWRDYFGENLDTYNLLYQVEKVVTNKDLASKLLNDNIGFKICVHQFFDEKRLEHLRKILPSSVDILYPADIDIMNEIVKSDVLITDYSSLGFDFSVLNKPVILFQPDLEGYLKKRDFYCEVEELKKHNYETVEELIECLIEGNYSTNEFFCSRLPQKIDYEKIGSGYYIDQMYEDFAYINRNKITFIGYNFYGIGGTVSATKSLAEGLMEQGYMVELLSLKQNRNKLIMPNALNIRSFYIEKSKGKRERIKRAVFRSRKLFGSLVYDKDCKHLIPYSGYALSQKMKNIKSRTIISTRETLHPFLKQASSPFIKNKLYFFHAYPEGLKVNFPKIIDILMRTTLETALFVTETNRKDFINEFGYHHYEKYSVVGNCVESKSILQLEDLLIPTPKDIYTGIILTRINNDRCNDLKKIINLGIYLRDNGIRNCRIDIYGAGNYIKEFILEIIQNELVGFVDFHGLTTTPINKIRKADFVLNLSDQSFGMIYLEAILNGKMVFTDHNNGADEVLRDIPYCYFDTFEELVQKINDLGNITFEDIVCNYEILSKQYSGISVAEKVIELLK